MSISFNSANPDHLLILSNYLIKEIQVRLVINWLNSLNDTERYIIIERLSRLMGCDITELTTLISPDITDDECEKIWWLYEKEVREHSEIHKIK